MVRPLLMCFVLCVVRGGSQQTEEQSGVVQEEPPSPLQEGEDLEALLGQDGESRPDQLSPEESIRRLGIIVDRIDTDKDDFISKDELTTWIQNVQRNKTEEVVTGQWQDYDKDEDGLISWDEYEDFMYGSYKDDPHILEEFNYTHEMVRDERRFRAADTDGDFHADKDEFNAFLHPENYGHMMDIVVQETIEDIDTDGDGLVDMNEYIEDDAMEPDLVEKERQHFSEFIDKNKDGKLDKQEMMEMLFPPNFDSASAEAEHLLEESDTNKDGKLTKAEILETQDVFVGSPATNFGATLQPHDEF